MRKIVVYILCLVAFTWASSGAAEKRVIRFGHFPNLTHAQALVAHQLSRQGKGWFESRLGPDVEIQWYIYNAGPSAMEALFSGALDFSYVGPNPVLNAYARSKGRSAKIIAGAASGGSVLLLRSGLNLSNPAEFKGLRIASPQLGNTQDVALRAWLKSGGLNITQQGGDAHVIPAANPDQLDMMKRGEIDAVWTVEPWGSRLELETGAKVLLDDRTSITTVLAAAPKLIEKEKEFTAKIVKAHHELTEWINANREEAWRLLQLELKEGTSKELPQPVLERSWPRISFAAGLNKESLDKSIADAKSAGFLPVGSNFDGLLSLAW